MESQENVMWTEKYRPSSYLEIQGQPEIVKRVKAFVEQKNMPHLLFSGPAGVGKTSLALVVAKSLYGDGWRQNFLELNASDERGIDVIRTKVKDFARTRAMSDVPFKIIYLDESDALTREAQQALRRTMELYTKNTRFILSSNYSSKIIDPIQSRCAVFHFKPLKKEDIFKIIGRVAENEKLKIGSEAKEALYQISSGDCRKLENILQSCAVVSKDITPELVYGLASIAQPKEVKNILEFAIQNKFSEARDKMLQVMLEHGLSGLDLVKQIQREIWRLDISNKSKLELISKCGETEFHITEGSDEFVQLEAFLAFAALQNVHEKQN